MTTRKTDGRVMLCPMSRQECLRYDCAIFNDETDLCGMDPAGLYTMMREAMTDAAVEVIRAYGKEDARVMKAEGERAAATRWQLSERERNIVKKLGGMQ